MAKSKKTEEKTTTKPSGLAALAASLREKYPDAMIEQKATSVVSTGSVNLDAALGIGGLPFGRIVEIYGQEAGGKSTLCLSICIQAQKLGYGCLYLDYEHALDLRYAVQLGVDVSPNMFIFVQPNTHEEGADIIRDALESGAVRVVALDSIAAAVPKAELEGDAGEHHVGLQARLNGQMFRKLTGLVSKHDCLMLAVNQLRMKVGVIYGSPMVTPGGNALKFYSSIRLDVAKKEVLKEGETPVGIRTRVKVVKNKLAAPFKEAEFTILFGHGIDQASDVLDTSLANGRITKAGAWFALAETGEKIGQGQSNALNWLRERPDTWEKFTK